MAGRQKGEFLEALTLRLPVALVVRIEEYWHLRRLGSRTEAIRELLESGLAEYGRSEQSGKDVAK